VNVSVNVTNSGKARGDDVVELYLNPPAGADAPIRALKGFKRVTLGPGASTQVEFVLDARDLSSVSTDGTRTVEPGKYAISVGGSQPGGPGNTAEGNFAIQGTQVLPK
jgi:beta-glucosidase